MKNMGCIPYLAASIPKKDDQLEDEEPMDDIADYEENDIVDYEEGDEEFQVKCLILMVKRVIMLIFLVLKIF
jgi:hypothetical protein